jgi:hypothetical protein
MDIALKLASNQPNNIVRTLVYDVKNKDVILERTDVFKHAGSKDIILKLPITSDKMIIESFSKNGGRQALGKDKSFNLSFPKIMPLKTYNVQMGTGDKEFIEWIKKISQNLPYMEADGNLRKSPSGRFKIVVFDKLRSHKGEYINSPAMIGKRTGTIEISKDYFLRMSQNQRVATLSHEYGHFYKNPLMKLPIGDETGADLNGMTLFLGNGFGPSEYINAFKKVFNGYKTEQNRKRYDVMKRFARQVYNGQYFGKPYNL